MTDLNAPFLAMPRCQGRLGQHRISQRTSAAKIAVAVARTRT
jgi:hypothetical protein